MRYKFFAVSPPGLEKITQAELFSLGINLPKAVSGGVEFEGFINHLYRVNLWSRTASRVLLRVGEFEAKTFAELERKAKQIEWGNFLKVGISVEVRATCHKSKLYHSDAVAERVQQAIGEQVTTGINQQLVVVRLDHDHCTISLDSSGEHLHQRGYRLASAKAPLRENIAAALLLKAKYDPAQPLIDPFCGSGTLPIEAAMIASNIAPGLNRKFTFTHWKTFNTQAWGDQLREAREHIDTKIPSTISASDRDAGAIEAASANADRAGVAKAIRFNVCSFSAMEIPQDRGLMIANLPYGKRVSEESDLRNLYAQLGKVVEDKLKGWRLALLTDDPYKTKAAALDLNITLRTENGGVGVAFLESTM